MTRRRYYAVREPTGELWAVLGHVMFFGKRSSATRMARAPVAQGPGTVEEYFPSKAELDFIAEANAQAERR